MTYFDDLYTIGTGSVDYSSCTGSPAWITVCSMDILMIRQNVFDILSFTTDSLGNFGIYIWVHHNSNKCTNYTRSFIIFFLKHQRGSLCYILYKDKKLLSQIHIQIKAMKQD